MVYGAARLTWSSCLVCAILSAVSAGALLAAVSTELDLRNALWNSTVDIIVLSADIRVSDPLLWTQPPDSLGRPPPAPLWTAQSLLRNGAVPIGRHLVIRGAGGLTFAAGSAPPPPSTFAVSLSLPLLDLTAVEGWLQLLPNASLRLQGLQVASSSSVSQANLLPYRPLLRALLSASSASSQGAQLGLSLLTLEGCIDRVNVGLPQSLAANATLALPVLPSALISAAAGAAAAADDAGDGAWGLLESSLASGVGTPGGPSAALRLVRNQLCVSGVAQDSAVHRRLQQDGPLQPQGALRASVGPLPRDAAILGPGPGVFGNGFAAAPSTCRYSRRSAASMLRSVSQLARQWLQWARLRPGTLCEQGSDRSSSGMGGGWGREAGAAADRLLLTETASSAAPACLNGSLMVDSAVTAFASAAAAGGGFDATTDGLAAAYGSTSGGSSGSAGAASAVLLVVVRSSYSGSLAQVDEACLGSAWATLCVQQALERLAAGTSTGAVGGGSDAGSRTAFVATLSALLPVAALLLCALLAVLRLYQRLHSRHNRERGAQRAPGVGPLTTLLVTDISNSTALWEALPEEVMDQALKLHHACLRALLPRFNGYESATEGDSFILAFHVPIDAAKYALAAQIQLMEVPWPAEVLAHQDGHEVWVVPRAADTTIAQSGSLSTGAGGSGGHPLSLEPAAGSMSVHRSSGGHIISVGAPGAARPGDYGSALRSSWTSRAARSFRYGPPLTPAAASAAMAGVARLGLEHMSTADLEADDLGGYVSGRTGSILRSFTSRMTTMLGLMPAPPALPASVGSPGGCSGGGGGDSSRGASSRVRRFLRTSLSTVGIGNSGGSGSGGGGGGTGPGHVLSLQGYGGGAADGDPPRGPRPLLPDGRGGAPMRSKSFGVGLMGRPRNAAPKAVIQGSVGGGVGSVMQRPSGDSFTADGGQSLLRQALSFNQRQGSFRGSGHAGTAAASAAAAAAVANVHTHTNTNTTTASVTGASTAGAASPVSAGGSRRVSHTQRGAGGSHVIGATPGAPAPHNHQQQLFGVGAAPLSGETDNPSISGSATGAADVARGSASCSAVQLQPTSSVERDVGNIGATALSPASAATAELPTSPRGSRAAPTLSLSVFSRPSSAASGAAGATSPEECSTPGKPATPPAAGASFGLRAMLAARPSAGGTFSVGRNAQPSNGQGSARHFRRTHSLAAVQPLPPGLGGDGGAARSVPPQGLTPLQLSKSFEGSEAGAAPLDSQQPGSCGYTDESPVGSVPMLATLLAAGNSSLAADEVCRASNASVQGVIDALEQATRSSGALPAQRLLLAMPRSSAGAPPSAAGVPGMPRLLTMSPSQRDRMRRCSAPADVTGMAEHSALPGATGAAAAGVGPYASHAFGSWGARGSGSGALPVVLSTLGPRASASAVYGSGVPPSPLSGRPANPRSSERHNGSDHQSDGGHTASGSVGLVSGSLGGGGGGGGAYYSGSLALSVRPRGGRVSRDFGPELELGPGQPATSPRHGAAAAARTVSGGLSSGPAGISGSSNAAAAGAVPLSPTNTVSPTGPGSLAASMARLLRSRSARRDSRVHSSPMARTQAFVEAADPGAAAVDSSVRGDHSVRGDGGGVDGAGVPRLGYLAPIMEPRASQELVATTSSAGGHTGEPAVARALQVPTSVLVMGAGNATLSRNAGSGGTNSAGQWPSTGVSASVGASGSLLGAYFSPAASRADSLSQPRGPPARGLSRANMLVRQLTGGIGRNNRAVTAAAVIAAASSGGGSGPGSAPVAMLDGSVSGHIGSGRLSSRTGQFGSYIMGMAAAAGSALGVSDVEAEGESAVELSAIGMVREGMLRLMTIGGSNNSPRRRSSVLNRSLVDAQTLELGGPPTGAAEEVIVLPSRSPSKAAPLLPSKSYPRISPSLDLQAGAGAEGAAAAQPALHISASGVVTVAANKAQSGAAGALSRRLSFLGRGLLSRSRTGDRRSSLTEEWQNAEGPPASWPVSQGHQPAMDCRSWREKCREEWPLAVRPAPPARCAYRGLRVRMGLHTGITTSSDVTLNPTTCHMAYGGIAIKVAKAVGDAASGGMILLSHSTFLAIVSHLAELPGSPQAVFSGESDLGLGPDARSYSLYQLVPRELVQRVGYMAPLRNIPLTQLGTEDAPTGFCAISFMHVASASMLVAELGQPGVEALQQFKAIVTGLCCSCGGYVVEASEGLCLAAFRNAAAALVWALCCRDALSQHAWSPEVRRWYRFSAAPAPHGSSRGGHGPRPRTGVHVGGVNVEVNAGTGRMTYRGKVMNRTSRIAHKAASEQIVCSKEAWDAVEVSIAAALQEMQQEEEERRAAAAAAAAASPSSSFSSGEGDMVSALGAAAVSGGGGPSLGKASARGILASVTSAIRGGATGRGVSGGGAKLSPPPSGRGRLGTGVKGLMASLAGGGFEAAGNHGAHGVPALAGRGGSRNVSPVRRKAGSVSDQEQLARRSNSVVAVAAAAAAALGRRVTSFTARSGAGSETAGSDISHVFSASRLGPRAKSTTSHPSRQASPKLSPAAAAQSPSAAFAAGRGGGPASPLGLTGLPAATTAAAAAAAAALAEEDQGLLRAAAYDSGTLPVMDVSDIGSGQREGVRREAEQPPALPAAPPQPPAVLALQRLVGPKVELPAGKRLAARSLGKFSLKGVREDMRLLEVFWLDASRFSFSDGDGGSGGEGEGRGGRGGSPRGAPGSGDASGMGMLQPETPARRRTPMELVSCEVRPTSAAAPLSNATDPGGADGGGAVAALVGGSRQRPGSALAPAADARIRSGRSDWLATDTGTTLVDSGEGASSAHASYGRTVSQPYVMLPSAHGPGVPRVVGVGVDRSMRRRSTGATVPSAAVAAEAVAAAVAARSSAAGEGSVRRRYSVSILSPAAAEVAQQHAALPGAAGEGHGAVAVRRVAMAAAAVVTAAPVARPPTAQHPAPAPALTLPHAQAPQAQRSTGQGLVSRLSLQEGVVGGRMGAGSGVDGGGGGGWGGDGMGARLQGGSAGRVSHRRVLGGAGMGPGGPSLPMSPRRTCSNIASGSSPTGNYSIGSSPLSITWRDEPPSVAPPPTSGNFSLGGSGGNGGSSVAAGTNNVIARHSRDSSVGGAVSSRNRDWSAAGAAPSGFATVPSPPALAQFRAQHSSTPQLTFASNPPASRAPVLAPPLHGRPASPHADAAHTRPSSAPSPPASRQASQTAGHGSPLQSALSANARSVPQHADAAEPRTHAEGRALEQPQFPLPRRPQRWASGGEPLAGAPTASSALAAAPGPRAQRPPLPPRLAWSGTPAEADVETARHDGVNPSVQHARGVPVIEELQVTAEEDDDDDDDEEEEALSASLRFQAVLGVASEGRRSVPRRASALHLPPPPSVPSSAFGGPRDHV